MDKHIMRYLLGFFWLGAIAYLLSIPSHTHDFGIELLSVVIVSTIFVGPILIIYGIGVAIEYLINKITGGN